MSQLETDLDRLHLTIEAFCDLPDAPPAIAPKTTPEQDWAYREVLAHLVYHHEAYVAQAQARLKGRVFKLPCGRFKDMNAEAVAAFRDVPLGRPVRRLRAADRHLRQIALQPGGAQITIQIKEGSKCWPLADLVRAVEAHVRRHHQQLVRSSKTSR
jgi:hypothetical protein